jgi:YD repeat-containing protein
MATTGKKFVKTSVDGLGRTVKVETGYNPSPGTSVVESVVDTEYAPCACTPMGKMKRVSQPYKPGNPVVWTTYTYDELGRAVTVTHPPNTGSSGISGTTSYLYIANTVKFTDPAGRWKKYTMDGYGNLTRVDEPKPASGTYVTTYTYSEFNQLKTVSMNRDGYNGNTPLSVNQTRTFAYDGNQRLQSTTFPETPGSTTYTYNADGMIATKTDYKGVRKYFYTTAKQLQRVEKYPGGGAEDVNARVTYYLRFTSVHDDVRVAVYAGSAGCD